MRLAGLNARPRRGLRSEGASDGLPHASADAKTVGFERERLLDHQLVGRRLPDFEALQQHGKHQRRFLHGECPPDAAALPVPERFPSMLWDLVSHARSETVRVELFRFLPHRWIAVECRQQHQHRAPLLQRIFSREHGVVLGRKRESGGGRPQPQRLAQNLVEVAELGDMLEPRRLGTEHTVCFGLGPAKYVGIFEQEVRREAE